MDGNYETRWTTGRPMAPGDWWQVDFGTSVTLTGVEIHHSHHDQLRGYEIIVSNAVPTPTTPADLQGENDQEVLRLNFDLPMTGRYFHLRQTASSDEDSWWSITQIVFLGTQ